MDIAFTLAVLAALLCYGGSGTFRARLDAIEIEDQQRGGL